MLKLCVLVICMVCVTTSQSADGARNTTQVGRISERLQNLNKTNFPDIHIKFSNYTKDDSQIDTSFTEGKCEGKRACSMCKNDMFHSKEVYILSLLLIIF